MPTIRAAIVPTKPHIMPTIFNVVERGLFIIPSHMIMFFNNLQKYYMKASPI